MDNYLRDYEGPFIYEFKYDDLSRLINIEHDWYYSESKMGYDANGNIKAVTRTEDDPVNDDFIYEYTGNQLSRLINGDRAYLYDYDANDNMTIDGLNALKIEKLFKNI